MAREGNHESTEHGSGAVIALSLELASVGTGMGLTASHKGKESRPALASWAIHRAVSATARPENIDPNGNGLRAPHYTLLASAATLPGFDAMMGSSTAVTVPTFSLSGLNTGMVAPKSVARPDTAYGCDAESAPVGVTCINIEGEGSCVKYLAASILVEQDFVGYEHIYGPGGVDLY